METRQAKRDFNLWQPHYEKTGVLKEKTHYIYENKRRDAYRLSVKVIADLRKFLRKKPIIHDFFAKISNYSAFPGRYVRG
jgi:hypothetical protein